MHEHTNMSDPLARSRLGRPGAQRSQPWENVPGKTQCLREGAPRVAATRRRPPLALLRLLALGEAGLGEAGFETHGRFVAVVW